MEGDGGPEWGLWSTARSALKGRYRELLEVTAERDRYKAALEEIKRYGLSSPELAEVARKALDQPADSKGAKE